MASRIKWRKAYDGREEEYSEKTAIVFDPSEDRTIQSEKDNSDINTLVRRFGVTGNLPRPNVEPFYGDFTGMGDYQTALNQVMEAESAFMQLPASVRHRFHNNPGELLDFVHDPDNREEARELGLLRPDAPRPPDVTPEPGTLVRTDPGANTAPSGGTTAPAARPSGA